MHFEKNELINFINNCSNCYMSFIAEDSKLDVHYIENLKTIDDIIMLAVRGEVFDFGDYINNRKIALCCWSKLIGYQLKGSVVDINILINYNKEYHEFCKYLKEQYCEMNYSVIVMSFDKVYSVTPGKIAGALLN